MKTSTRAIVTLVPAAMLAGGFAGCAGESPPPPPAPGGPWDGVAIRAYVGKDATRVDFRYLFGEPHG